MLLDIVAKSLYSEKEVRNNSTIHRNANLYFKLYWKLLLGFY